MTTNVDMGGNTLIVEGINLGATAPGQTGTAFTSTNVVTTTGAQTLTGQKTFSAGINTKQAVTNVNDTTPTKAELTTAFGDPTTIGRGFIGTIDDNDGDTNGYLVWASDANYYFIAGTKAT